MATIEDGSTTSEVTVVSQGGSDGALLVTTPGYKSDGTVSGAGTPGAPSMAFFSENDPGTVTGARNNRSPETDADFKLRIAHDHILDRETFNYTVQNTGKHSHTFTAVTATVSANGLLTNSGSGVATNTGMTFGTFAEFPVGLTASSLYCETNLSLNQAIASIPSNAIIDIGMFRRGASTAFAPGDGVYFRFSSAGITAVINNSAVETTSVLTGVSGILANENHLFGITITEKVCEFWIDNVLYASLTAPSTSGQAFRSASLPWSVRHANTGAVGAVLQAAITDYSIISGGAMYSTTMASVGNRSLGSHQGLSGVTVGSLATYANSTTPAASAGSNTAANVTGLGGQGQITAQATGTTDNIMTAYQVPAGTVAVQGRRLAVYGVKISCANLGAAVATTPTTIALSLAFGHTAVSLATPETGSFVTATTKAPRREALGIMYWDTAAPIGATPQNGDIFMPFTQPIYVNPGEFIATAMKFITGTATASQAIYYHVTFDYGWE